MAAQAPHLPHGDDEDQPGVRRFKVACQGFCTTNEIIHVEFVRHDAEDRAMIELFLLQDRAQRRDQGQIITLGVTCPERLLSLEECRQYSQFGRICHIVNDRQCLDPDRLWCFSFALIQG